MMRLQQRSPVPTVGHGKRSNGGAGGRSDSSPAHQIIQRLQQTAGNQAVAKLLQSGKEGGAALAAASAHANPVQMKPFDFKGETYDTDNEDEVYNLAESLSAEEYGELLEVIRKVDASFAETMEKYYAEQDDDQYDDDDDQYDDDDDGYDDDDPYGEYQDKFEKGGMKQQRKLDNAEVGTYKRGGSKSVRDKWYGGFANNKDAQTWWHQYKQKNHLGDLSKDNADLYFAEYEKSKQ